MTTPPSPNTITPLLVALKHQNPHVRAGAAIALGKPGNARAVEPLIDLLEDPVYLVYTSAEKALGKIGSLAIGALMAVIQAPPSLDSASRAYEALRMVRDPQAVDLLIAATTYEEPFSRWGAIEALGEMRAEQALPALMDAARHPEENTRQHAVLALGKIGRPEGVQVITTLLNETDWQMRITAVRALGQIGTEEVILPLLTAMRDPIVQVRETAAQMLTNLPAKTGEVLVSAMNGADAWTRRQLARALGEIQFRIAIPLLEKLALDDDDVQVRLSAAQSLAMLNHPRGEAVILRTLNAPSVQTRTWAAIALGNAGKPTAITPLLDNDLFNRKNGRGETRQVSGEIITAFKRIGKPAVKPLIEALESPDRVKQETAFKALTEIGQEAVPALLESLETTKIPRVYHQIIQLLGLSGDPRAVEPLSDILRLGGASTISPRGLINVIFDPTARARKLAADALGNLGLPECTPALLAATRYDLDQDVRDRAAWALALLGDRESILQLAESQTFGKMGRGIWSVLVFLVVGLVIGMLVDLIGNSMAGLLAGLGAGALAGLLDGLVGEKRILRGVLIGLGIVSLWGVFDVQFANSPPLIELVLFPPVQIGTLFLGGVGCLAGVWGISPLLRDYRVRYVPRGCLALGLPVLTAITGGIAGGVIGAVLVLQAGDPAFFRWFGGIALGVLLLISWLQRGNQIELQKGLLGALGLLIMMIMGVAFALSMPQPITVWLMPLFPVVGAVLNFQPLPLARRLLGLFGGMVAGALGAGIGLWIIGNFF